MKMIPGPVSGLDLWTEKPTKWGIARWVGLSDETIRKSVKGPAPEFLPISIIPRWKLVSKQAETLKDNSLI